MVFAVEAQKGVMEFLLINHPLDCPICDQGGECQLQDIAVGYGNSHSRFKEEKRSVTNKDLGSLISTEMTRCIHCSRCVRFTDEIAGYQELGMSYRNNHVEVMPFIGKTVNSELSGNIIDICPVGALTSKPFRNQYRSWELSRRKTIAPHDGLGSNLIVQVDKYHKVVRVLPYENESINECWLSDRDRFSYEGLYHEDRITSPMIKQDNKWQKVDWETAIAYVVKSIRGVINDHGVHSYGVLAGSNSTTEELYLLQKLMRSLDIKNIDHRLTQIDFTLDQNIAGISYVDATNEEISNAKSILLIGSVIREEQPLLAHRIREAVKCGAKLNVISVLKENLLCKVEHQVTIDPREIAYKLSQVLKAIVNSDISGAVDLSKVESDEEAKQIAANLINKETVILIGEVAKSLPNYSDIYILAQEIARVIEGKFGVLASKANEVGAKLVGFLPYATAFNEKLITPGLNAYEMLQRECMGYFLMNTELELDSYNSQLALNALKKAKSVIVMSAFISEAIKDYADVILPITPFTETAGSYVNMQGVWQKFNGVTKPLGDSKPAWKVLRVLGNHLVDKGFDYNSIDDVRAELTELNDMDKMLDNSVVKVKLMASKPEIEGLVRFGIQGVYALDSITRRAKSLQKTYYAQLPVLSVNQKLADKLKLNASNQVEVSQGLAASKLTLSVSNDLPDTVVLLSVNQLTTDFAGRYDSIKIQA